MFFKTKKISSMEHEIFEQAVVLDSLFKTHVNDNNYILFDIPTDIQKVVLVASGSSYHCARYTADLFGDIAGIEARAIYSSEFLLKSAIPHEETILYVFITQSGETSDTNLALKKAKEYGMRTLCITNTKGSSIWEGTDYRIDCLAGEEKSIAATKSLTTQMLCCTLLVLKYAAHKRLDIVPYLEQLRNLPIQIENVYNLHSKIKKCAKFLAKFKNLVITADGISYALAKEASLKIKETSYINVYSNILGEFMHGHLAVLNNKQAMIYISTEELTYTVIKNLNKIINDYKTPVLIIGYSNDKIKTKYHLDTDVESSLVKPFCSVVIIQLLALEIAKVLKRNVDKPHGLDKVVR